MRRPDAGHGVLVTVTIDAATVMLGDQLTIGGQVFTIRNMAALPRGARRLEFESGESFTLLPATVLYALRRVVPRRGRAPRPW
ncbi:hypothetical protein RM780_04335 [Streptomyces sp. DSM 44917]|uniref:Uncharacterized protein n=1 Tax=Streptomyces boetiae TaxID=3075541 RepID=A0ABU2L445_9ACTN|nr:hypothetical protein [Streptomyces sp. DSM 44917]MDT0306191.1 hypothetical protein [Streptomyces sp. DSM 44917]